MKLNYRLDKAIHEESETLLIEMISQIKKT